MFCPSVVAVLVPNPSDWEGPNIAFWKWQNLWLQSPALSQKSIITTHAAVCEELLEIRISSFTLTCNSSDYITCSFLVCLNSLHASFPPFVHHLSFLCGAQLGLPLQSLNTTN